MLKARAKHQTANILLRDSILLQDNPPLKTSIRLQDNTHLQDSTPLQDNIRLRDNILTRDNILPRANTLLNNMEPIPAIMATNKPLTLFHHQFHHTPLKKSAGSLEL
jgi:hypothetical protein